MGWRPAVEAVANQLSRRTLLISAWVERKQLFPLLAIATPGRPLAFGAIMGQLLDSLLTKEAPGA